MHAALNPACRHHTPRMQIRHLFYGNLGRPDVAMHANAAAPYQCLCTHATTSVACSKTVIRAPT